MKSKAYLLGLLMALAGMALTIAGCGSDNYTSVEGIVLFNGAPLPEAKVMFHAPGQPMATARTDESGHFSVETGGASGMKPGKYEVTIAAYSNSAKPTEKRGSSLPKLIIPEKYLKPDQSGLEATIGEGANHELSFELTGT